MGVVPQHLHTHTCTQRAHTQHIHTHTHTHAHTCAHTHTHTHTPHTHTCTHTHTHTLSSKPSFHFCTNVLNNFLDSSELKSLKKVQDWVGGRMAQAFRAGRPTQGSPHMHTANFSHILCQPSSKFNALNEIVISRNPLFA